MLKVIRIEKYRGFKQVSFTLGSHLTVIAGQNGTQKTTLLGMLTQMFTLDPKSPMGGEKPLIGGNSYGGLPKVSKRRKTTDGGVNPR